MAILLLIGMVFVIIWEMFHGRIYLNSVLLLLLVKFVSESSLELIHIYIPHHKYMFKPHSSPWFLAACAAAAAIVHRNHFFSLNQQIKSCECKVKFRQASNEFKGFWKLPNFYMLIKQVSITSPKVGCLDSWWIANNVLSEILIFPNILKYRDHQREVPPC